MHVSIGIPVYKGQKYVAKALQSILAQDHRDFDVLISVDNGDIESASVCRKFLKDSRIKLQIHQNRLGWVKNISYLMQNQKGDFWFYIGQDDLIAKNYISKLLAYAQAHPEASVVYSDIQCFGSMAKKMIQPSLTGGALDREINLIKNYLPAIAIRGLIPRRVILASKGFIRDNNFNSFCCDTAWMATLARFGELHRIPNVLYKKRYHDTNTHLGWLKHDKSWLENAWVAHCRDMFLEALPAATTIEQKYELFNAIRYRLLRSDVSRHYIKSKNWSRPRRFIYLLKFAFSFVFG